MICRTCGAEIPVVPGKRGRKPKFCGPACRDRWWKHGPRAAGTDGRASDVGAIAAEVVRLLVADIRARGHRVDGKLNPAVVELRHWCRFLAPGPAAPPETTVDIDALLDAG